MKHWIACLSAFSVLWVTGCDTTNHSQMQVLAPKVERGGTVSVPAAERDAVKQLLSEIAVKHRFEDRTQISLIPEVICSYAQPDVKYPMRIVAWSSKDRISVDLFQKPPETGESEAYRKLRSEIMSGLQERFGKRLTLVQKMDQITSGSQATP